MSSIQIKVTGDKDIDEALAIIPKRLNKTVLLKAYRKAGNILVKDARSRAPKNQGKIKKSIGIVPWKNTENNEATVRIGPRRKRGAANMQGWHSHMVEYGTQPRSPIKKKKLVFKNKAGGLVFMNSTQGTRPQPFMQPAIQATKTRVEAQIKTEIGNVLETELRKRVKS